MTIDENIQNLRKMDYQIFEQTKALREKMESRKALLEKIKSEDKNWIDDILKVTLLSMDEVEIYV